MRYLLLVFLLCSLVRANPDPCHSQDCDKYIRGDVNGDGIVNYNDFIHLMNWWKDGFSLTSQWYPFGYKEDRGDVNDKKDVPTGGGPEQSLTFDDVEYLAIYLYQGGSPPPEPFPTPGLDETLDELDPDCDFECFEKPYTITGYDWAKNLSCLQNNCWDAPYTGQGENPTICDEWSAAEGYTQCWANYTCEHHQYLRQGSQGLIGKLSGDTCFSNTDVTMNRLEGLVFHFKDVITPSLGEFGYVCPPAQVGWCNTVRYDFDNAKIVLKFLATGGLPVWAIVPLKDYADIWPYPQSFEGEICVGPSGLSLYHTLDETPIEWEFRVPGEDLIEAICNRTGQTVPQLNDNMVLKELRVSYVNAEYELWPNGFDVSSQEKLKLHHDITEVWWEQCP